VLLRPWVNAVSWAAIPGHGLSAVALPLGLVAWLEVDRVRAPGVEVDPQDPEHYWFPLRAWALKARQVVIPLGITFTLGVGVVFISLVVGSWVAWEHADMEPGALSSAALFSLLCVNGAILLVLRKRSRQTLRRAVVGAALTHIPLWWLFVFPTQFDATEWKRSLERSELRSDMAEDLIYSRVLLGKTRSQVLELLGTAGSYSGPDQQFYSLRSHTCKGFLVRFDGGTAVEADFFRCD
jgi:hypothetical protein